MTIDTSTLPYRPCVGIALFNAEGKVFAGRRIDSEETPQSHAWQMPQGGIDPQEDIEAAALRELKEETGTHKAHILRILQTPIRYDLPPHLIGKIWGGKYRGQDQTWVAMRFTGTDADIDIAADDHPEFSEWRWIPLRDMLDLVVPFKRKTYEKVIAAFTDLAETTPGQTHRGA